RLDDHCSNLSFCNNRPVNNGLGLVTADIAAALDLGNMELDDVARTSRLAEPGLVDAQHQHDVFLAGIGIVLDHDRTGGLRHAFNDQHARQNRVAWEVTLYNWLIERDILDAHSCLVAIDLDDLVDHQERITMRQAGEDLGNAHRSELGALGHPRFSPLESLRMVASSRQKSLIS